MRDRRRDQDARTNAPTSDSRERESKSMRDLRHQAFQDVELSKEETYNSERSRSFSEFARDESIACEDLDPPFAEYEPRCYLFIMENECVRRLMLTGLLIFIYAGSHTQITVGHHFSP